MSDVYQSIDDLIVLCEKKVALLRDLKKALLLADLIGVPAKEVKGSIRHGVCDLEHRLTRRWKGMVLRVTYDGVTNDHPLLDVPHDLWPADVLVEYMRHVRHTEQLREWTRISK